MASSSSSSNPNPTTSSSQPLRDGDGGGGSIIVDATVRGARHESAGMESDTKGDFPTAITHYRAALIDLGEAIEIGTSPNNDSRSDVHPDVPVLEKHSAEISERIKHLEELVINGNTNSSIESMSVPSTVSYLPISTHIKPVQLSMQVQRSTTTEGGNINLDNSDSSTRLRLLPPPTTLDDDNKPF